MAKLDLFSKKSKLEKIVEDHSKEDIYNGFHKSVSFLEYFILPILVLYSASISMLFVFFNVLKMTNSVLYAFIGGIMIVLIIEGIKMYGLKSFIKQLLKGSHSKGQIPLIINLLLGIVVLISYAGSIYLAVEGSPILADHITNVKSEMKLNDLGEINKKYNSELSVQDKAKNKAYTNTWKGKVTDEALSAGKQIEKTKQQINEARLLELAAAKETNDRALANQDNFKANWGSYLSKFGGYSELLEFLIILIICFFERAVFLEQPNKDAPPYPDTEKKGIGFHTETKIPPAYSPSSETRPKIGFFKESTDTPITEKEGLLTFANIDNHRKIEDVEREVNDILRSLVIPYITHVKEGKVRASTGRTKHDEALEKITIITTTNKITPEMKKRVEDSLQLLNQAIAERDTQ